MNKGFRIAIGVLCLIAAASIGIYVFVEWWNRKSAEDTYRDLAQDTIIEEPSDPEPAEEAQVYIPERNIDWGALRAQNPDIYAWVYIPDTNIDYPVLQHPTDDLYYLEHNLDGSTGYPGCIYTEKTYNNIDFQDPVTVLYGHNMKNGSMFSNLHLFEDETYFKADRFVYIYTPSGNYAYEVFAAYELDDRHLLAGLDLTGEGALEIYESMIKESCTGRFKEMSELTAEDKLITLSTCVGGGRSEVRFMIQGRRL